ncbi:hypothetical protein E3T23_01820 [Cryobacterium cheniae]|uniref:Uncharacterized protein n=1 Tax=Cryobacterium cheniae TaxID=1259262 RepID=A0A4R8XY61_9MICO|nr:hypothetical protein E3T23_01820 [Cryobacterium cheniae]
MVSTIPEAADAGPFVATVVISERMTGIEPALSAWEAEPASIGDGGIASILGNKREHSFAIGRSVPIVCAVTGTNLARELILFG